MTGKNTYKNITSERSADIFPKCGRKTIKNASHERFQSLQKNAKKFFFGCFHIRRILMDLNWTFSSSLTAN